jgi:pentatricopeptide repeat protein
MMEQMDIEEQEAAKRDKKLVAAYHALKPEEKAVYDQRKAYSREMSLKRKAKDFVGAIDVYKKMVSEGIPPDHYIYSQVLNMYAQLKRPSSAEKVWNKMLAMVEASAQDPAWNISKAPNRVWLPTLNAMIHVWSQSDNLVKAMEVYDSISSTYGLKPDEASFQPILFMLASRNDIASVERLYFDWKVAHPDFVGSVRLYTLLIIMYGNAKQYHTIATLFDEMKEKKVKLDPISIQKILKTLIVSDEQITSDLVFKLQGLGALNNAFPVLANDLTTMDEALTLLASMKASEVAPDVGIFNTLIPRVCKDIKEAKEMLSRMENEYGLKPNGFTFDALLMMAATPADKSKVEDVAAVSADMQSRGILPSESTYCILIRFYSQIGMKSVAIELLDVLKSHKPILSPKTHNAVIRLFAFGGPYDKLLEALKEVQEAKVRLDSSTVDIMFQSMMRRQKFLDCSQMLTHMIHNRERVQMKHILALYSQCLMRAGVLQRVVSMSPQESANALKLSENRTPGHISGDLHTVLSLHQVMYDTPGALNRAPAEYFVYAMAATAHQGAYNLCRIGHQALKATLTPEDRTVVFVEFLKLLDAESLQFSDDVAAWKLKLVGEGRTNPLIQSQYAPFLKYVQNASKTPVTGSRINRPTL